MVSASERIGLAALERVIERVEFGPGCWGWTGSLDRHGYGQVRIGERTRRAHDLLYRALVGPVGDCRELHHRCTNRRCVRPGHLEPVTKAEHGELTHLEKYGDACKAGHPRTPENTYIRPDTGRPMCRACKRERDRGYYEQGRTSRFTEAEVSAKQQQPDWPRCNCGCGQPAPVAPQTDRRRGWVKGEPLRFVKGHNALQAAEARRSKHDRPQQVSSL